MEILKSSQLVSCKTDSKQKLKLAFDALEKEMEIVVFEDELRQYLGGILRDANGNVIYVQVDSGIVTHPSGDSALMGVGYVYADDGTPIQAYYNIGGHAGWDTDCHGVSFADGDYWINDDQVGSILSGDGYSLVDDDYSAGDVVVYYDSFGNVVHSATISNVNGSDITVYGQGGLEVDNTYSPIDSGFSSYSSYSIYRQ